jgi:hypothetical protein
VNWRVRLLLAAVVLAAIALGAMAALNRHAAPPAELDLARAKASAGGLFMAAVEPEGEPAAVGVIHSWVLTLRSADGVPVEGAKIAVDGGMPQHDHGLPTSPQATAYLGEGRYRIEGVRFNMGGWWELKFAIEAPTGRDTVTFNLVL